MPGMNGTGPAGAGPMTGRQMGNCQGAAGQGYGCGRGMGRNAGAGRGMGRGFGFNPQVAMPQNDVGFLKSQAQMLENNLKAVNQRISELEQN